jgi:hypothetical protein
MIVMKKSFAWFVFVYDAIVFLANCAFAHLAKFDHCAAYFQPFLQGASFATMIALFPSFYLLLRPRPQFRYMLLLGGFTVSAFFIVLMISTAQASLSCLSSLSGWQGVLWGSTGAMFWVTALLTEFAWFENVNEMNSYVNF